MIEMADGPTKDDGASGGRSKAPENIERELAELRESERLYRMVADFTYDWTYWQGPDGAFLYISPSCERITGYGVEEFLADPLLLQKIIFKDDRGIWHDHSFESTKNVAPREVQFRILRKDGQICWIEHACQPVIDEKGIFLGYRVSNRDITVRKQTEETLRVSRSYLSRAQEVAQAIHGENGAVAGCNVIEARFGQHASAGTPSGSPKRCSSLGA